MDPYCNLILLFTRNPNLNVNGNYKSNVYALL
jgi:hypothetical protein